MELNQEKLHISSYLPLGLAVLLWLSIASISLFTCGRRKGFGTAALCYLPRFTKPGYIA